MLKIYFTASTSFDGEFKKNYHRLISFIKKVGGKLTSGEQIVKDSLLTRDKSFSKTNIFTREKKLIDQSDCVIAEATKPSLGVGGEIVYALIKDKPVLALVQSDFEDKISPMVSGNPSENLFLEFYNIDGSQFIIEKFIKHVQTIKKRRGKLIVIDGGDGSGKTTQAKLLVKYLQVKNILVKYVDFPQYYNSFHGKTVAKFLRGEFGKIDEVSPYLASLAYALDRVSLKEEMEDFLKRGGIIIANRYATSNMAHQAAKFKDKKQQETYLKWVFDLEYKVHKIPKENLVMYLHVPWRIGLSLTDNKPVRHYLNGESTDIHEKDLLYRHAVEKMYLELSKRYKHWVKINCVIDNKILPPYEIHKRILQALKQIFKI
jgi:dTMP kinase